MKIGLCFDGTPSHRTFMGDARFWRAGYFEADVVLHPDVERSLELTKGIWSRLSDVPTAVMDKGNHGVDRGLVFNSAVCDTLEGDDFETFTRSELIARVSFGSPPCASRRIDYSDTERLHISVYGARQFFPANSRRYFDGEDRAFCTLTEQVHVSLRWIGDKFDDWSNLEYWWKDINSQQIEKKQFDDHRTIYCASTPGRISRKGSSDSLDAEGLRKLVRREKRKVAVIPLSPSLRPFENHHEYGNEALNRFFNSGIERRLPIVGYSGVMSSALGGFLPYASDSDLPKMTRAKGIDFLFGEVLPGVEKFVNSR